MRGVFHGPASTSPFNVTHVGCRSSRLLRRRLPDFLANQENKLLGNARGASLDREEDSGNVAHGRLFQRSAAKNYGGW